MILIVTEVGVVREEECSYQKLCDLDFLRHACNDGRDISWRSMSV